MKHASLSIQLSEFLSLVIVLIGAIYLIGMGGYTPNEIRAAIGAPAIPGGDELNLFGNAINAFYAKVAG